jgi:tetratricopeptide (TPR) repeat protein
MGSLKIFAILPLLCSTILLFSCSSFTYKTYHEKEGEDDPEPVYTITLNQNFQDFTDYMFIGNRIENFGTYFNTFYNASYEFNDAYEEYQTRVLATYSEKIEAVGMRPVLSQEATDKFNKSIEKTSRVIQFHKSTRFMDQAVILIGKAYYFLGDYLKAERKFSEFISKLTASPLIEEALLYLAKTQLKLNNSKPALERLNNLINTSKDRTIVAEAYQTLGEYYIVEKDYQASIDNYKKSIQFSENKYFKAQIQFLIATVTALTGSKNASSEFKKVLEWETTYELEFLARYNLAKNLIISNSFYEAKTVLKELIVDYKDNLPYLGDIMVLNGRLYDQRKEYKKALEEYLNVVKEFSKTVASSDASFYIGNYYENIKGDYLNALRFYNYSNEESSQGRNVLLSYKKIKILNRYFELRSIITGKEIKTEYDSLFYKMIEKELPGKQKEDIKGEKGEGGYPSLRYGLFEDSLKPVEDSASIKKELVAKAKFELAELFSYDLNKPDSAEFYYRSAYEESGDPVSKSQALFALAIIDKNSGNLAGYENKLNRVIEEFPLSVIANECRRLLNIPLMQEDVTQDPAESLYTYAETNFNDNKYREALESFIRITILYPESVYLHKSYLAAGWIYENILNIADSSYLFYSKLMELNPSPEIREKISAKVAEYHYVIETKDTLSVTDTSTVQDTTSGIPNIHDEQTPKENEEIKDKTEHHNNEGIKEEETEPRKLLDEPIKEEK